MADPTADKELPRRTNAPTDTALDVATVDATDNLDPTFTRPVVDKQLPVRTNELTDNELLMPV